MTAVELSAQDFWVGHDGIALAAVHKVAIAIGFGIIHLHFERARLVIPFNLVGRKMRRRGRGRRKSRGCQQTAARTADVVGRIDRMVAQIRRGVGIERLAVDGQHRVSRRNHRAAGAVEAQHRKTVVARSVVKVDFVGILAQVVVVAVLGDAVIRKAESTQGAKVLETDTDGLDGIGIALVMHIDVFRLDVLVPIGKRASVYLERPRGLVIILGGARLTRKAPFAGTTVNRVGIVRGGSQYTQVKTADLLLDLRIGIGIGRHQNGRPLVISRTFGGHIIDKALTLHGIETGAGSAVTKHLAANIRRRQWRRKPD